MLMRNIYKSLMMAVGLGLATVSANATALHGSNGLVGDTAIASLQYMASDNNVVTIDNETLTKCDAHFLGNGTETVYVQATGANGARHESEVVELVISCSDGVAVTAISANALSGWTSLTTLTITQETIPSLGAGALPSSLMKIVVPKGMANDYAAEPGWSAYANIIEDAEGNKADKNLTSLSEKRSEVKMVLSGKVLTLGEEAEVLVYNLAGQRVYGGRTREVVLPGKGVYIVTVDGKARRLIAK